MLANTCIEATGRIGNRTGRPRDAGSRCNICVHPRGDARRNEHRRPRLCARES
jgi:hypothetical protein